MRLGDAILCYNSPDDARKAVESGLAHTPTDTVRMLFDNSQDFRIGAFMLAEHPEIAYIRSPYNVGTCISRNWIAQRMIREGCTHWAIRDQDVAITADGWLSDMAAVFQQYPDTGIVSWECIAKQMTPHYERKDTGLTPEIAGACCMVSAACVRAVGGWYPKTLFMRMEDTDFCFQAGLKGFRTRLVLGEQKIAHDRPGSGMARNPRDAQSREYSETVFRQRCDQFGYPRIAGVNA